jgi:hypothetical protein
MARRAAAQPRVGGIRRGGIDRPTEPALAVGAALVLLAAFVVRERTTAAPLFDLDLLKDRGILGANICLLAYGASNAGEVLLVTLYLQEGRGLSPLFTGLCFIPQAAGAFALAGPASKIVPGLGPRRALAAGTSLSVLALVGSALSVGRGSLSGLLVALFIMGISARVVQVASTLAGTRGPVAAKAEGSASALLTATRQIGSALGVAFLSATLVIAPVTPASAPKWRCSLPPHSPSSACSRRASCPPGQRIRAHCGSSTSSAGTAGDFLDEIAVCLAEMRPPVSKHKTDNALGHLTDVVIQSQ